MLDHVAVTSFSPEGYSLYGKKMLKSFLAHWDIPIFVFFEGIMPELKSNRICYLDLDEDKDRAAFLQKIRKRPMPWHMDARRFCHKVFALTSPLRPECRWWIWCDADVIWRQPVNSDAMAELLPEDTCLSFLGRRKCKFPQLRVPECGFVGYKTADLRVQSLLDDFRHVYTSGEIHTLPQKHDSFVFWHILQRSGIDAREQHDMTPNVKQLDVWDHSPLQRYGSHQKGPRRKMKHYGNYLR